MARDWREKDERMMRVCWWNEKKNGKMLPRKWGENDERIEREWQENDEKMMKKWWENKKGLTKEW